MSSDPDAADALDRLARGLAPQVTGLGGSTVRELIESRLFASSATVMLGRFELHRVLGAGGMGVVYLARDPELDRKVAIKLLHAELEHPTYDAIRDEAAGLARVSHPNVVTVHEIGTDRGRLFFVMEHVAGSSIDEFCAALGQRRGGRGRALERAIVDVFVQAARGLAAIHRAGLVHRDFKPANVLVGDDGRPRVTDFGLARVLAAAPSTVSSERGDSLHTLGAGTVAYMSPEQIRGEPVDVRADVFGFSASLYQIVAGLPAYPTTSRDERLAAIEAGRVARPSRRMSPRLHAVLRRGLAAESAERWPSMDALIRELEPLGRERALVTPLIAAGLGTCLLSAVVLSHSFEAPCTRSGAAMEEIWNDTARAVLAEAFQRAERSYADVAQAGAEAGLDAYASTWIAMSASNCRATLVHGTQSEDAMDRRSACLTRRLEAMRGTIGLLREADAGTVREALAIVEGLPPVPSCGEVEDLLARPRLSPDDELMLQAIDGARAQWLAGRFEEAERRLAAIADAAADPPELRAEHALLESRVDFALGRFDDARAGLDDALLAAAAAENDELIAQVQTAMLFQDGHRGQAAELVQQQAVTARASVLRAGSPPELAATLGVSHAIALARAGRPNEAVDADLSALAVIVEHGLGSRREGLALLDLAQAYLQSGSIADASSRLARARELLLPILGSGHPIMLAVENTDGAIAMQTGDYERARTAFGTAAEGLEAELGRDHPRTMSTLARLAAALEAQERWSEAIALQREVVEYERLTHPRERSHGNALVGLGTMLEASGHPGGAVESFTHALAIYDEHAAQLESAYAELGLAAAFLATRDTGRAREHVQRAIPVLVELLGEQDIVVGQAYDALARSWLIDGEQDLAAEQLRRGASIYAASPELRGIEVIEHALLTADVALAGGDAAKAADDYRRARDLAIASIGPHSRRAVEAVSGEARAWAAVGDAALSAD